MAARWKSRMARSRVKRCATPLCLLALLAAVALGRSPDGEGGADGEAHGGAGKKQACHGFVPHTVDTGSR